jgi:hypothetical protein
MPTIEADGKKLEVAALRYTSVRNAGQLDIDVFVPGYTDADKALANLVFVALDHTLGEYDVETKLAGITLHPLAQAPADARPLADLPAAVDAIN